MSTEGVRYWVARLEHGTELLVRLPGGAWGPIELLAFAERFSSTGAASVLALDDETFAIRALSPGAVRLVCENTMPGWAS